MAVQSLRCGMPTLPTGVAQLWQPGREVPSSLQKSGNILHQWPPDVCTHRLVSRQLAASQPLQAALLLCEEGGHLGQIAV
jgi:hypothetical protein